MVMVLAQGRGGVEAGGGRGVIINGPCEGGVRD